MAPPCSRAEIRYPFRVFAAAVFSLLSPLFSAENAALFCRVGRHLQAVLWLARWPDRGTRCTCPNGPNRVEIVSDSRIRVTRCQCVPRRKLRANSSLRAGPVWVVLSPSATAVGTQNPRHPHRSACKSPLSQAGSCHGGYQPTVHFAAGLVDALKPHVSACGITAVAGWRITPARGSRVDGRTLFKRPP